MNATSLRLPAWPAWIAAAVFAILAAVLGFTVGQRDQQLADANAAADLLELENRSLQTTLESERIVSLRQTVLLREAETRAVELSAHADLDALTIKALAPVPGNAPEATAMVVWNPLSQDGLLTVSRLPAPDTGRDYQFWIIDSRQPNAPVDAGVFTTDAITGDALHRFKPATPVETAVSFAVTLERKGGSAEPVGPKVIVGP